MDERLVVAALEEKIIEMVERILACCDGLDDAGVNWKPDAPETNSIFVLATHTIGNVRQNVLSVLGGEPDQRDRDAEFVAAGDSAETLRREWAELKPRVVATLGRIGADDLTRERPHPRRGTMTGLQTLVLAAAHAGEHAGQAELTRDLYRGR